MFITILVFILVLGVLVFVHELGHFLVAKKIGVRVEEFGFGLPPRIWGVKRGETIYSLNWLPIGGFVKLAGEDMEEPSSVNHSAGKAAPEISQNEIKRNFWARSKKERAAILLAGVTMNFVLGVAIISFIFTQGVFVPTDRVHIEKVLANTPAALAGLSTGDVIVSFGGVKISTSGDIINTAKKFSGQPVEMIVLRNQSQLHVQIIPRKDPPKEEGPMGIVISNLEEKKYPWYQAPFYGTIEAVKMSLMMLTVLLSLVWRIITFQKVGVEVAGPIGIAQATGEAIKFGYMAVLQLMGILSLNLALINILPIPALDGGRLLFVVLEKFLGRKVKPRAERIVHQVGMAFLLGLIVLVTINDIVRLIKG